jgi:hypothetical protein
MARWHEELQDYNFVLEHVPGKNHTAVNTLSRPPGCDEGKDDNRDVQMLPEEAFICVLDEDLPGSLENRITNQQLDFKDVLDDPKVYPGLE